MVVYMMLSSGVCQGKPCTFKNRQTTIANKPNIFVFCDEDIINCIFYIVPGFVLFFALLLVVVAKHCCGCELVDLCRCDFNVLNFFSETSVLRHSTLSD